MLDLSKFLKGLMQVIPWKFFGIIFKKSLDQTLMSVREEPESMFLILMPKFWMHDGQI